MIRLVLMLLGTGYLRRRWRTLTAIGWLSTLAGVLLCIDALDNALHFPLHFFAYLLLLEALATLAIAWTGLGGQRLVRYIKGIGFAAAAALILGGGANGHFVLSMVFGTLFLVDGLLQSLSAIVVRYPRWRVALWGGLFEIALALFYYQPYPTHYLGTVPYSIGLGLAFGGWNMILLAYRVRALQADASLDRFDAAARPSAVAAATETETAEHDPEALPLSEPAHPPASPETSLIVHVWTPIGSARARAARRPLIDRYIAAVDANGIISTGHAALEAPDGLYISLYPAVEIDYSTRDFSRRMRATAENNVAGRFLSDYATEAQDWCESTRKVRIHNYDAARLRRFWENYRLDTTYNLTRRNCSGVVARALEAALEGAVGRVAGDDAGWLAFFNLLFTPELWVATQLRKRAKTMAWTPGLVLDYARALSMLVDPRPFGWRTMFRLALRQMRRSRRMWESVDD
ncbi:MAG: DUF308 domain-containing protein [Janthinobacterium lividum]